MTIGRDSLTKAVTVMVAAIEAGVPTLVEAREIITQFHLMIRRRLETGLSPWIERARASLIASFASGVARDEAAVRAAITSSWSNGQTEGQITRLELVRRQMYGGGKLDLLQARLIGAIGAAPKLRQSQYCKLIPIMLLVATSEKPRNVTGATLGRQHDIIA
jgi:transposase